MAGHVNYATSKGGIHMMMKTLAQELAPQPQGMIFSKDLSNFVLFYTPFTS